MKPKLKRLIDIILASLMIITFSPALLAIAILVRLRTSQVFIYKDGWLHFNSIHPLMDLTSATFLPAMLSVLFGQQHFFDMFKRQTNG